MYCHIEEYARARELLNEMLASVAAQQTNDPNAALQMLGIQQQLEDKVKQLYREFGLDG